ncbi:MAG: succinate dehydrogenase cytochrome b subunit, partial [Candidatus Omnitrophica bacterium]|nr:succinate dehydrogenase cytochrome b subunit [Candidatus Omnitrophota bacterium]
MPKPWYDFYLKGGSMSGSSWTLLQSSIIRKQIVAVTGLMLVGFLIAHLTGNFLLFAGPEAFNGYSKKLHDLGAILWVLRIGLLAAFLAHIYLAIQLTAENHSARKHRYAVSNQKGDGGFAKRSMIYTGLLVFLFVALHLYDFTFRSKTGDPTVISGVNEGESLGLFGLVWNSFLEPWHAGLYILAMIVLGLHLSHGIQSL